MKRKLILVVSLVTFFLISGCSNSKKETTNSTQKNEEVSTTKKSSESEAIASTDGTIEDSSIDDVRKENPTDTVSKLRRQLYEAGINSSTLSDSELEKYKEEADEKGMEFTKYVFDIMK